MHEFSLAHQIIGVVEETARERGATEVSEIVLRIGELSFVAEEQLLFAMRELAGGTLSERARVRVKKEPGKVRCPSCAYEGEVTYDELRGGASPALCPGCGAGTEVVGGTGCYVESVSLELPEGG
jgi:hydrogenase nickel incorporation protein HypA/HybF